MNATIIALLGYVTWTLVLVVMLGGYRSWLTVKGQRAANQFKADGSDSPPFGQRLTRAFNNCVESFAFIGGLMLLALATNSNVITDPLAYILLAARLTQTIVHLLSTSVLAVQIRFVLFLLQVVICFYWITLMMEKFIG